MGTIAIECAMQPKTKEIAPQQEEHAKSQEDTLSATEAQSDKKGCDEPLPWQEDLKVQKTTSLKPQFCMASVCSDMIQMYSRVHHISKVVEELASMPVKERQFIQLTIEQMYAHFKEIDMFLDSDTAGKQIKNHINNIDSCEG